MPNIKAIRIDPSTYKIVDDITIIDYPNRKEGLYYNTSKGLIPVAYCFKYDERERIQETLDKIALAKANFVKYEYQTIINLRSSCGV